MQTPHSTPNKTCQPKPSPAAAMMTTLAFLIIAALLSPLIDNLNWNAVTGSTTAHAESQDTLPEIKAGEPLPADLFIRLAKLVNPAVVNIFTATRPQMQFRRPGPRGPGPNDPYFDLFDLFFNGPNMQSQPRQSLGTGFIIRKDGLIITNNHVIEKADVIKVQMTEQSDDTIEATVIGRDSATDIALIKINSKKSLPVARLGISANLQVGEWVAAFGNPFGHGHTMTKGIISAIGREIDELNRFPFLQTDASINPGNSGGPLVNMRGEVIGVNAAIDARAQGIGFAIPIDNVKSIIGELEKNGSIRRGFLGVLLADVNPEIKKSLKLSADKGALITQVIEDSPAEKAGLKPYDVITQVNAVSLKSSRDLVKAVSGLGVGERAQLKLQRGPKEMTVSIEIGVHPDDAGPSQSPRTSYVGQKAPFDLGFKVVDYNSKLAQDWQLPKLKRGRPVVIEVEPNSPASGANLAVGDLILDVNGREVYGSKELFKALKGDAANILRVLRGQHALLIMLKADNS